MGHTVVLMSFGIFTPWSCFASHSDWGWEHSCFTPAGGSPTAKENSKLTSFFLGLLGLTSTASFVISQWWMSKQLFPFSCSSLECSQKKIFGLPHSFIRHINRPSSKSHPKRTSKKEPGILTPPGSLDLKITFSCCTSLQLPQLPKQETGKSRRLLGLSLTLTTGTQHLYFGWLVHQRDQEWSGQGGRACKLPSWENFQFWAERKQSWKLHWSLCGCFSS